MIFWISFKTFWRTLLSLILIALTVLAVMLLYRCSGRPPAWWTVTFVIVFPELYLVYYALRQYVLKDASFCPALPHEDGAMANMAYALKGGAGGAGGRAAGAADATDG